uniref:ARAD1B15048p n=1 Tax=Blastobotrys adeninivorans TaxID=409370 RepID=A0A060T5X2_BLAAD
MSDLEKQSVPVDDDKSQKFSESGEGEGITKLTDDRSDQSEHTGSQYGEFSNAEDMEMEKFFRLRKQLSHVSHMGKPLKMGPDMPIPPTLPEKPYIVRFEENDDLNPLNWTFMRKCVSTVLLGLSTFTIAFGSSAFAPAVPFIAYEFGIGRVPATLGVSLYVAGFAAGPVFYGPMSEMYGRKLPIVISQFGLAVFSFGTAAAKDVQTIMLCRFFAGFTGSAAFAVVAGAMFDFCKPQHRGVALMAFMSMVYAGTCVGAFIGGFVAESYLGWRWTSYLIGIVSAFAFAMDVFFLKESLGPLILSRKAALLRRQTGNWAIHATIDQVSLDLKEIMSTTITRPIRMIFTQPIVFLVGVYISFVYGILYLCLEAIPIVFMEHYGWSLGVSELPYIGVLLGVLIGVVYMIMLEPRYFRHLAANGFKPVPEARLDSLYLPGVIFPMGLFLTTWAGNYADKVHWIVPVIGCVFIGFGILAIFAGSLLYLSESYLPVVASVMASNTFMRSGMAAAFPLFANAMFHNMGLQWAGTLLGCIGVVLMPIPVIFRIYSAKLKKTIKYD